MPKDREIVDGQDIGQAGSQGRPRVGVVDQTGARAASVPIGVSLEPRVVMPRAEIRRDGHLAVEDAISPCPDERESVLVLRLQGSDEAADVGADTGW